MSSASNRESLTRLVRDLQIVNWPLMQEPARAWTLIVGVGLAAFYAGWRTNSVPLGVTLFIALMGCLWRLWLPVRFEFGPRGVTQIALGRTRRIAWRTIAGYEFRRRGVLLLPDEQRTALAPLRGLFVRYGSDEARLRELIEFYLAPRRDASSEIQKAI